MGLLLGGAGLLGGLGAPAPAWGAPPAQEPFRPTPAALPYPPPVLTAIAAATIAAASAPAPVATVPPYPPPVLTAIAAATIAAAPAGAAGAAPPAAVSPAGPTATAVGPQLFSQTGYRLGDPATDAIAAYFYARGGVPTFGYPVSRPFLLQGVRVQVFQRHVLQQLPTGVAPLNLLDGDYLPYTDFGTAVVPAVDPAVAGGAPPPGTPDYGTAVDAYLAQTVPDTWEGQPVGFREAYLRAGRSAGEASPAQQTLVALEVLGFPTSAPAPDPRTPQLVAQRFQRGVLQYDATRGLTEPLLLADYFKAVLTGRFLPPALAAQSRGSPYALQYRPGRPGWLARPEALPGTDLTQAFAPDAGGPDADTGAASPADAAGATPTFPPVPTLAASPSPPAAAGALGPPGTPGALGTPGTPGVLGAVPPGTPDPRPPVVEGAEPGGAAVGQDVVLRGRGFGDQPGQVLFTGKLAQAQLWSPTLLVVTVPQGATDGTVRVRRADGTLSNAVGFAPATTPTASPTGTTPSPTPTPPPSPTPVRPAVTGIEPHYGGVGTTIQVSGRGFGTTTGTVLLGSQTAPVQLWSDTSVLVQVPAGADLPAPRTQRLRVVRPDGATGEPVACFIVSPGTPTPTPGGSTASGQAAAPTATPAPATAC